MTNMGMGHRYSTEELKEIDRLVKARKRLLKRVAEIDAREAEYREGRRNH